MKKSRTPPAMYLLVLVWFKILAVTLSSSAADNRVLTQPSHLHPSTPEPRNHTDGSFWQRIGDHSWSHDFCNPCQSHPDPYDPHSFDRNSTITNLNITGRLWLLRLLAGNYRNRLMDLQSKLSFVGDCNHEIPSLPPRPRLPFPTINDGGDQHSFDVFTPEVLEELYNAFLYLSAHFKVMEQDWEHGQQCSIMGKMRDEIQEAFQRHGTDFEHSMCTLLGRVDGLAPPYPDQQLQERVYQLAMQRSIMHYPQNCHGRVLRDCIVVGYATNMLNDIFRAASAVVTQRRSRRRRSLYK